MCLPFCEMLRPASSDSTFLLSPLIWDGVLAFQGSYFPLLLISCCFPSYWMLCLPVWVSFFPVLSFCLLLSPLVFSCFPLIFLVRRVTMGRTLLDKLYGVSGGIIVINLADFRESISSTSEVWGLQPLDWVHQCATKPGCKFQEPNTPGRSAKGSGNQTQLGTNKVPEVGSGTTLGSFGCVVPTSGLAFLHIAVPEKIEKYRKASKPLQHAF